MDKSIHERLRERIREHGQTYKIDELCLDELPICEFTPEINKLLEKCINLQYLTLQNCRIAHLNNAPRFPKLTALELDNNMITEKDIPLLADKYSTLRYLSLRNNQLRSFKEFASLCTCKNLEKLLVSNNQVACSLNGESLQQLSAAQISLHLYSMLPDVSNIDYFDRYGNKLQQQESAVLSESEGEESDEEVSQEEPEADFVNKSRKKQ